MGHRAGSLGDRERADGTPIVAMILKSVLSNDLPPYRLTAGLGKMGDGYRPGEAVRRG